MSTIKSYTDIEQSRKLAKILPIESADMCYLSDESLFPKINYNGMVFFNSEEEKPSTIIPCWSLAALLGVLPALGNKHAVFGTSIKESKWHVLYHNIDTLFLEDSGLYDNLIDACYEMILKLHELKIL